MIVPTYNERDNLPTLAERVLNQPVAIDMLVVDDGSPDGTGDIADALAKKHPSMCSIGPGRMDWVVPIAMGFDGP